MYASRNIMELIIYAKPKLGLYIFCFIFATLCKYQRTVVLVPATSTSDPNWACPILVGPDLGVHRGVA